MLSCSNMIIITWFRFRAKFVTSWDLKTKCIYDTLMLVIEINSHQGLILSWSGVQFCQFASILELVHFWGVIWSSIFTTRVYQWMLQLCLCVRTTEWLYNSKCVKRNVFPLCFPPLTLYMTIWHIDWQGQKLLVDHLSSILTVMVADNGHNARPRSGPWLLLCCQSLSTGPG